MNEPMTSAAGEVPTDDKTLSLDAHYYECGSSSFEHRTGRLLRELEEARPAIASLTQKLAEAERELSDYKQECTEITSRLREMEGALRLLLQILDEWHQEFPEGIGDKEVPAMVAARVLLSPTSQSREGGGT